MTANRLLALVQNAHAEPRSLAEQTIATDGRRAILLKLYALPLLYRQGVSSKSAFTRTT
jgi:hypothetical protein